MRALLVLVLLGGGCGVYPTENQKQLNSQNIDAGKQIQAKAIDPEIKQAGLDVQKNSETLETTLIGKPEKPALPYTPQNSAQIRTVVVKEYDEAQAPWYKRWAGTLLTILGVAGMAGIGVARFFPAASAVISVATPILRAVAGMKQQADAQPDDKLHVDEMQTTITGLTQLPKIGPLIADKLKDLHLEQMIHSPEAPDIQPATPLT
jgi:hypothetical protein